MSFEVPINLSLGLDANNIAYEYRKDIIIANLYHLAFSRRFLEGKTTQI